MSKELRPYEPSQLLALSNSISWLALCSKAVGADDCKYRIVVILTSVSWNMQYVAYGQHWSKEYFVIAYSSTPRIYILHHTAGLGVCRGGLTMPCLGTLRPLCRICLAAPIIKMFWAPIYLLPSPQLILYPKFYSQIKTILFVRYFLFLISYFRPILKKTDFLFNCKNK